MNTTGGTPFDLLAYARQHRLRVRNVHDGAPVPPMRRPRAGRRRARLIGADDRLDAIIGRFGYVDYGGRGSDWIGGVRSSHDGRPGRTWSGFLERQRAQRARGVLR